MATSLADLLAEITRHVERRHAPDLAAETVAGIAQLNRCIPQLAPADTDPDRGMRHGTLVIACREFCSGTANRPGRIRDLAGVAADLIMLTERGLGSDERWAVLVAINDTLDDLSAAYRRTAGPLDIPAANRLAALQRSIRDVDRAAAAQPPTANDARILTRPVPSAARRDTATTAAAAIVDAAAGLQYYTAPPRRLSLAELLAVTIAADTVCRCTDALLPSLGERVTAWRAVQESLRPFNDGSRRADAAPSPLVVHGLNLHDACLRLAADQSPIPARAAALRYSLEALVTVAGHLRVAISRWSERRTLSAYAVDLNAGYLHPVQHLAGHQTAGIISAGPFDLRRAIRAVDRAKEATMQLSLRANAVVETYRLAEPDINASANHTPTTFDPSISANLAPHRHL